MAAELISIVTDRPEGSFTVVLETKLRPDLADLIGRARRHRDAAREAQRRASAAQCEAVRSLAGAGLTTRDSGRLLA